MYNEDKDPVYLSLRVASTKLGISYRTLFNWCRDNTVPHIKIGNKYMLDVPETLKLLRSGKVSQ